MLGHQASRLSATHQDVEVLNAMVADLQLQVADLRREAADSQRSVTSLPPGSSSEAEPYANSPPLYDGDPNSCRAFLAQCSLVFALQPR